LYEGQNLVVNPAFSSVSRSPATPRRSREQSVAISGLAGRVSSSTSSVGQCAWRLRAYCRQPHSLTHCQPA